MPCCLIIIYSVFPFLCQFLLFYIIVYIPISLRISILCQLVSLRSYYYYNYYYHILFYSIIFVVFSIIIAQPIHVPHTPFSSFVMHSRSMLYQLHGDIGFFNTFIFHLHYLICLILVNLQRARGQLAGGGGVAAGCLGWSPMSDGHVGL